MPGSSQLTEHDFQLGTARALIRIIRCLLPYLHELHSEFADLWIQRSTQSRRAQNVDEPPSSPLPIYLLPSPGLSTLDWVPPRREIAALTSVYSTYTHTVNNDQSRSLRIAYIVACSGVQGVPRLSYRCQVLPARFLQIPRRIAVWATIDVSIGVRSYSHCICVILCDPLWPLFT